MAGEDDIVSNVAIDGADAAAAELTKLGDQGAAAFEKLGAAADKASGSLEAAGAAAGDAGNKGSAGLAKAGDGASQLAKVEQAATAFGSSLRDVGSAAASFATRVGAIGAAAAGAVGGVILLARSIAQQINAANSAGKSSRQLNAELRASSQQMGANKIAIIQNAAALAEFDRATIRSSQDRRQATADSITDLEDQLAKGLITVQQFQKAKTEIERKAVLQNAIAIREEIKNRNLLIEKQAEEKRVAQEVAFVQASETRARLEKANAIKKETEAREAFNDVEKKFGTQLTFSLLRLGTAVESVFKAFQRAFGSVAAGLVDKLTNAVQNNKGVIIDLFFTIAKEVNALLDKIDWDKLAKNAKEVFTQISTFVKDVIIPAFKLLIRALDEVAKFINNIFGTNFSGTGLLVIGILLRMVGAFKLLWTVIRSVVLVIRLASIAFFTLTPWGRLITLIVIALVALAVALKDVDWSKLAAGAGKAVTDVVNWFKNLPDRISKFFADLWSSVKQLSSDAVQWVIDKWNAFIQFFADLWQQAKQLASDAWEWVKQKAADAAQWVQDKWNAFLQFFTSLWERIKQFPAQAWEWIKQTATDAVQLIIDKWNAFLQFFVDLWEKIKQLAADAWNSLAQSASDAMAKVKQFVLDAVPGLQTLIGWIDKAAAAWKNMGQSQQDANDLSKVDGMAGGGRVRGRGTSTSDSIFARLSNGEYVVRARAVVALMRQFGSGVMDTINRGRLPGFNMGGLVDTLSAPLTMPSFAGGGSVAVARHSGGQSIILNIGGESFDLVAPEDSTADRLGRYASKRRLSSSGRKPSYYGSK